MATSLHLPSVSVLEQVALNVDIWKPHATYIKTYPAVLSAVAALDDDHPHAVTLIAMAVYAWMPRILRNNFDPEGLESQIKLKELREMNLTSGGAWLRRFIVSGSPIDNSWVALSKVLHFINPIVFPIFDSKVALSLGMSRNSPNIRQGKTYYAYFELIHDALKSGMYDGPIKRVQSIPGSNTSAVRCFELLLFGFNGGLALSNPPKRAK